MKLKRGVLIISSLSMCLSAYSCGKATDSSKTQNNTKSISTESSVSQTSTESMLANSDVATTVLQTTTTSETISTTTTTTTTTITTTQAITTTSYQMNVDNVHYNPLYEYLIESDEGSGFFYDIDKDGYEDMILCDDWGVSVVTYWNSDTDAGFFGWNATLKSPVFYIVTGSNSRNYICCEEKSNNELKKLYYDFSTDEEIYLKITYANDGTATWYVGEPMSINKFSYDRSSGVEIYGIPADCRATLDSTLSDYGMLINSNSNHNRMNLMTYNQMKDYLLKKLGRSSSLMNNDNSYESACGEGFVHTEGGMLNVRESPSTSSSVVAQIANGTEVYIEDDSYEGWLLVYGFDDINGIFSGYVAEEFIDWQIVH